MLITLIANDTIMDTYSLKTMQIHELLIIFLNMDIDSWFDKYQKIDVNNYQNLVSELLHIEEAASSGTPRGDYFKFAIDQLIKGSLEPINTQTSNSTLNLYIDNVKRQIIINKNKLKEIQNNLQALTEDLLINKINFHENIKLGLERKIEYYIQFASNKLVERYKIKSIDVFCIFAISKLLNSDLILKRCNNCNDFFVPTDPREIYCDKIHTNGRTCKQMGYENKINDDEIMRNYRRVYKNKNAHKNRNKHNSNAEKDFKQWVYAAKLKMELCKDGEISLEEFKQWLNNN